jgi:hypothetical protein
MTFSPRRRILDQTNDAALLAAIVRVYGFAASVMAKSLCDKAPWRPARASATARHEKGTEH